LECVRDYCADYSKGCKGKFSDFKRAYIDLVIDHLNDVRLRERRLYHAITGEACDASPQDETKKA
jgi:hypothetical protein